MADEKCVVLFSGGLDSRLAVRIMQKKGFEVVAVHFKLPFSKDSEDEIRKFCDDSNAEIKIFDCAKGKLFKEYLAVIKDAKFGRGAGINPCVDCKIFMFQKAKKFADAKKIKFIATGEVEGQRPMSQTKKSMSLIEEKSGLRDRIIKPLCESGIFGRQRKKQIAFAKKFKINYPSPAGGCILCEKELKKRFEFLLNRGMDKKEAKLVNVGRHFVINDCWVVIGRNEKENKILESFRKDLIVPDFPAPTALVLDKPTEKVLKKVNKLIKAYSKQGSLNERKNFEKYKI